MPGFSTISVVSPFFPHGMAEALCRRQKCLVRIRCPGNVEASRCGVGPGVFHRHAGRALALGQDHDLRVGLYFGGCWPRNFARHGLPSGGRGTGGSSVGGNAPTGGSATIATVMAGWAENLGELDLAGLGKVIADEDRYGQHQRETNDQSKFQFTRRR